MIGLVLISNSTYAIDTIETTISTDQHNNQISKQTLINETTLNATMWNISVPEYERYIHLLKGARGSLSVKGITPYEVLGIHAKTPADRKRFAERWVNFIYDDTELVSVFNKEVNQAWVRLKNGAPMLDHNIIEAARQDRLARLKADKYQKKTQAFSPTQSSSNTILMFLPSGNCSDCRKNVDKVLEQLNNSMIARVEFYITDLQPGNDDKLRSWVSAMGIPPELFINKIATIDYATPSFETLKKQGVIPLTPVLPYLITHNPRAFNSALPVEWPF